MITVYVSELECQQFESEQIENIYDLYNEVWIGHDEISKMVNNQYLYYAIEIMKENDIRDGRIVLPSNKVYHIKDYYVTE